MSNLLYINIKLTLTLFPIYQKLPSLSIYKISNQIKQISLSMAESQSNNLQQPLLVDDEDRLKYLEFVQFASFHALMYAAKLYSYAKENSGPLKTGVNTIEGTVKNVVGPVYDKYHDVPIELLKFVDRKVDESVTKMQTHVPPIITEVKKTGMVGTASGMAKTVISKYEPTAKELYAKYEPVAEQYAASTWRSLNQLPLFPRVAQAVVPIASYSSEKYNQTVQSAAERGYKVAPYLPLVPTERIAKVFGGKIEGEGVVA